MNNLHFDTGKSSSGNRAMTNLQYSTIRDFTAMKNLTVTNLSDAELQEIAEKFPEITDIT